MGACYGARSVRCDHLLLSMASILSRATRLSAPISARTLLRASRSGIILPRYYVQPIASLQRAQSTAAALKVEELFTSGTEVKRPSPAPRPAVHEEEHSAIEDDQAEFTTLKNVVSQSTLKALTVSPMQLQHMSPVQEAVLGMLPDLIKPLDPNADPTQAAPRDLLVKARTGTGKTIAFLVPAIEARLAEIQRYGKVMKRETGMDRKFEIRAQRTYGRENAGVVIISPTRELATQIAVEATKLVKHHPELRVHLFVGGESKRQQMRHWMESTRDIIVATPGRLRDMLENEPAVAGPISKSKFLVLDEADTLLEMGFREDIESIAKDLAPTPERQTFMFSATVSKRIQQVAESILDKNHAFINCVSDDAPPVHAHVPQYHTVVPSAEDQIPHVLRLIAHDQLTNPDNSKVLLFLPTTKMTQLFSTILQEMRSTLPNARTRLFEIHSKRTQQSRTKMSNEFRNDTSGASVLVSSDVSARGVDYPGVTRVIQVGIPASGEQYVHRVGRTGRGKDKHGRADLVLLPWELGFVTWQLTDIPMKPLTVSELTSTVRKLAEENDAQPKAIRARISNPYLTKLNTIPDRIKMLQENMDKDAVKETMASLLGYYASRSGELRCDKGVIVAGVKAWTVEACGLEEPPYISEAFLTRIGAFDQPKRARRGVQSYRRDQGRVPGAQWRSSSSSRSRSVFGEEGGDRFGGGGDRFGGGFRRRDSEGGSGGGYRRRDGESGGFQRRDDGERNGGFQRREGGGGGFQRRDGERGGRERSSERDDSSSWFTRGRDRSSSV
ncbi:P-loop containing nucleoside triphosphate hydrolase protein [Cristinia sonorae]|uniref:ATP-dependent RNA helicase n=1 Tax=Cristinia sonorae TaxID=1940300 RepID=A0A8K0URQ7_9AGAR|nr:P-loop containing nucleoside triphosphate hydrolase protein [Cristinia sonorae]